MTSLKQNFIAKGFSIVHYAKKVGLDHSTLSKVLNGKIQPISKRKNTKLERLLNSLKEDGILGEVHEANN